MFDFFDIHSNGKGKNFLPGEAAPWSHRQPGYRATDNKAFGFYDARSSGKYLRRKQGVNATLSSLKPRSVDDAGSAPSPFQLKDVYDRVCCQGNIFG